MPDLRTFRHNGLLDGPLGWAADQAVVATVQNNLEQLVRIVIIDEQPIFRDGLRWLIETEPGLRIVGEVGNGSDAVALVRDLDPDVLLLGLAGKLPLQTLQAVTAVGASVRIIVLTPSVDTPEVARALQLGARFICYGADILMVKRGLEQIREECSSLGFSFDSLAEIRVKL